jgi:hypothetical protein
MRRKLKSKEIISSKSGLLALVGALGLYFFVRELPQMRRYIRVKRI